MELNEDDLEVLHFVDAGSQRQIYDKSNHFVKTDNFAFYCSFIGYNLKGSGAQIKDHLEFPINKFILL